MPEIDRNRQNKINLLAIDCCEHTIEAISRHLSVSPISANSRNNIHKIIEKREIDLIVIGVNRNPVRRFFLNRLRHFYPNIPILFLRREKTSDQKPEKIGGEFLIDTNNFATELQIIGKLKQVFPIEPCEHLTRGGNYLLVNEAIRVMRENFNDPHLNLEVVARKLPVSPSRLSRVLNRQVGISFRHLLKQIRISEAKQLIASNRYTIKEIAVRTGFSDRHYFSKSFKEVTGVTATKYEYSADELIFD